MEEIKLITSKNTPEITSNFAEIRAKLSEKLAEYKGYVFTEESLKVAKKEKASLVALKKDFDTTRKLVKSEYLKNYEDWEKEFKEVMSLIDEPINEMVKQFDAFEVKRVSDKKNLINEKWSALLTESDLENPIDIAKIYSKKWENVTCSMKEITTEMTDFILQISSNLASLKNMNCDIIEKVVQEFLMDFNFQNAINKINSYEANKREVLQRQEKEKAAEVERLHQLEISRIRNEERKRVEEESEIFRAGQEKAREEVEVESREVKKEIHSFVEEKESDPYSYVIILTEKQKVALETFLNSNKIDFSVMF